jgi:hypothetical protein
MIELQKLSTIFEADNPDIKLNWVVVEENILRQRVTTDVSTGSGQCELVFIGLYDADFCQARMAERDRELPCRLRYPFRPSSPSATSASNSRHRTAAHTAFPRKTDRHESI